MGRFLESDEDFLAQTKKTQKKAIFSFRTLSGRKPQMTMKKTN